MIRLAADGRTVSFLDDPAMLNLDPPDHTRLHKLATHGFLHKHILSLEPRVTEIVDRCLESYDTQSGTFNIVTQIAKPLPAIVIAELLGLPESDLTRFQKLSIDLLGLTALGDDEQMERGAKANEDLISYFSGIIDDKRRNPDQALISRLIAAEEEGDRLSAEEVYSTAILLLIAGHETTTRLISNGIYTLLQHPEQLALLRDNPDLAENAIEEMLRFEPPIQFVVRFAREDLTFHGKKIKKNQLVAPIILSANRDPAANDNPDVFDIERDNIKHVSFGYGIHLCLGMTLARLEGRIAINKLLQRFPDMTLADQPLEWSSLMLIRGLENLIIETNDSNNKSDLQSETDAA
ncbi:MAG: cytochrome P450 [Dinoroseobacter sp.]|jgi:cytochrome P450